MTVVVWDGKTLAVDRGVTDGFTMWEQDKVWRHGDELLTGTGNITQVLAMRQWYLAGATAEQLPDFQRLPDTWVDFIVVSSQGLRRYERSAIPIEHGFNKCAFGYGRDFAYGALAMGATAEEAVIIACRFSPKCGMGVDIFSIQGEKDAKDND